MENIYIINLLVICLTAISTDVAYCNISRVNKRITNVEVELDTVNSDIAAFRLELLDVWDKMDEMNKTMCPVEKSNGSEETEENNMKNIKIKPMVEPYVSKKMLYSAFQSEKRFVREYSQSLIENIKVLEEGQKRIQVLVNKQTESIENIVQDIEILNSSNIVKNMLTKVIGEVSNNIQTTNDKVFVLEQAQENIVENMTKLAESIKTAIQDKEIPLQKIKKIDQLESEVRTLKVTLDTVMNQMNRVQLALDVLKDRASCSPHWHRYGQSCYFFSTNKLTWQSAKYYCRSQDSYLAEFKDAEEVKTTAELALSISPNGRYWIGASDISSEMSWSWSKSGTYMKFNYWLPNNPDDFRGEDCVETHVNQQGRLNDNECNNMHTFMCQTAKLK